MAYIDSGSYTSVISSDFYESIPKSQRSTLLKTTLTATSVTKELLDIIGTIHTSIHLGNTTRRQTFMVARGITHPVIIGWDFFWNHNASLSTTTFSMPGVKIPLVSKHQHQAPLKCNVSLVGQAVIPPLCETHVHGRLSSTQVDITPANYDGIFEPGTQEHLHVASARCLSRPQDGLILIRLINPSQETIDIPADTNLGQFYSITGDSQEEYEVVESVIASTKLTHSKCHLCFLLLI